MPTPRWFRRWLCIESTGNDNTIRVWLLGTWEQVRVVRVSGHVPKVLRCQCLATSGSKLLC